MLIMIELSKFIYALFIFTKIGQSEKYISSLKY